MPSARAPASSRFLAEAVLSRGDAIEAECFAFLAVRVLRGLPMAFPSPRG